LIFERRIQHDRLDRAIAEKRRVDANVEPAMTG
jgi:hypothetical protein